MDQSETTYANSIHPAHTEDIYDYVPVRKEDPSPHHSTSIQYNSTETFAAIFRRDPYHFYKSIYGNFNFPSDFTIEYSDIHKEFPVTSLPRLFREQNPHISYDNICLVLQECASIFPKIWGPVHHLRNGMVAGFVILIFTYFCLMFSSFAFLIFLPSEGLIICLSIVSIVSILFILCFIWFAILLFLIIRFGYWKTRDSSHQILSTWNNKYFSTVGIELSLQVQKKMVYGQAIRYLYMIHFHYTIDKSIPFGLSIEELQQTDCNHMVLDAAT